MPASVELICRVTCPSKLHSRMVEFLDDPPALKQRPSRRATVHTRPGWHCLPYESVEPAAGAGSQARSLPGQALAGELAAGTGGPAARCTAQRGHACQASGSAWGRVQREADELGRAGAIVAVPRHQLQAAHAPLAAADPGDAGGVGVNRPAHITSRRKQGSAAQGQHQPRLLWASNATPAGVLPADSGALAALLRLKTASAGQPWQGHMRRAGPHETVDGVIFRGAQSACPLDSAKSISPPPSALHSTSQPALAQLPSC